MNEKKEEGKTTIETKEELIENFLCWLENYHPIKIAWEKMESQKEPNQESYPYDYFRNSILKFALKRLLDDYQKSLFEKIEKLLAQGMV